MQKIYNANPLRCLATVFVFFSASQLMAQNCQLNPPTGLYISDITSCSATFHWKAPTPGSNYTVYYKISTSTVWAGNIQVRKDTSYSATGLLPATKYTFAVTAKCTDGSVSSKQRISATTAFCSLPDQVSIEGLNSNSAKITVAASCSYDSLRVRYNSSGASPTTVSFAVADSYIVSGLSSNSTYLFQVSTCPASFNLWTDMDTLQLSTPPNIIFILIDDSRSDYFSCNGAPRFFQTPNIDRIANEGVNFKKSFVVTSLCQPSRASIATGLFTLKTGVTENGIPLDSSFTTIPKVLNNNGYYTALIGKNHDIFLQGKQPEFNYYMVFDHYVNNKGQKFDYNGTLKSINKDYVLTLTDSAIRLVKSVNDPLFIWLAYVVPHYPQWPLASFVGRYDNFKIPWKPDTAKFDVNFPSFIYKDGEELYGETLDTTYRNVLEDIAGLDSCIGELYKALESSGKLDNTLLIFTSDNGFMMGSHQLNGKTHAYEPSMRIPLFIRYPEWFIPSSTVNDQFALNLDLTPTIYEAAQVDYQGSLDGVSLKKLYDGSFSRKEFYYLMLHNPNSISPVKRAIRDSHFKYIHYTCNPDTVEELFDMKNDSLELTNLINNSNYAAIANVYRLKYDSIRIAWNDTVAGPIKNCYIQNPFVLKQIFEDAEETPLEPVVYPTITDGSIEIYIPWAFALARLYDNFGKQVGEWQITDEFTQILLPDLSDGIYYMNISHAGLSTTEKLIIHAF